MFRDFAGVAGLSLAAIYVRNVFALNVSQAGLFVGIMMLPSVICNPLAVYLTPKRRRLPGLTIILILGGLLAATAPFWPLIGALIVLCAFQTMQLASYAVSDAATLERISPEFRGRVVGLFLQIAGTFGALGPWVMGAWTDHLHNSHAQLNYVGPFAVIGALHDPRRRLPAIDRPPRPGAVGNETNGRDFPGNDGGGAIIHHV